jgi:EmrB/QacA subfamily drug resistance transporter
VKKGKNATTVNVSFVLLLIGVFMAALDNGIISAALTTINSSFDVSATAGTWGITLYTLGLAIATPIVGKLSDRYGRKKLFLIEIVIFTIGSLGVALSPNFTFFLAARLFQSFGGGGIFIIASSHVISTFHKEKQGSMLGLLGGMNGIASVVGPNIGSFLMDVTGTWHWLFLINVPIGILIVIGGYFYMQETKDAVMEKIDFLGITLLSFSILSVMFAVNNLGSGDLLNSLLNWSVLGLLILGIIIFAVLIFIEKRNEMGNVDTILPYSLLRKPTYSVTMIMAFLSGAFIGAVIFIPSFAEQVLGIPAVKSGYWMTPLAIAAGVGASAGGYFVDKQGSVRTLILSGFIAIIGFGGLGLFVDTRALFIIFSVIAGIGFGFVLGAPLTVLTSNAAGTQKGSALGTLSVARQIGLTISPTVFGTFIQRGFSNLNQIIPGKLQAHGVDPNDVPPGELEKISGQGYSDIQSSIAQIPSEDVRAALLEAFHEAAHNAYAPIYFTAAGAAILIIILSILFHKKFNQDAIEEDERGQ